MSSTTVDLAAARSLTRSRATSAVIPWTLYAVLFASTSVIIGIIWDVSWHSTIGRDTFWTPAHMAIYVGGLVAGLACGWLAPNHLRGQRSPTGDIRRVLGLP